MTVGTRLALPALVLVVGLLAIGIASGEWRDPAEAQRATPGQPDISIEGPTVVTVSELPPASEGAQAAGPRAPVPRRGLPAGLLASADVPPPAANALDAAFADGLEPRVGPAITSVRFDGLDDEDNSFPLSPPDPQVAVGPDHVFEMVNIVGRIYSKSGTPLMTVLLADFFNVPPGYLDTDPKVVYDSMTGRWFAAYLSFIDNPAGADEGLLHLAVSQTGSPLGAWNLYEIVYLDVLPDYPGLGLTSDKVTISSNVFDIDGSPVSPGCTPGGYCGDSTVVLQKSDVVAGDPVPGFFAFPFNISRFTVRPAHSLTAVTDQYLTTFNVATTFPPTSMTVIRVTGTPDAGNVMEAAATNVPIITQDFPPPSRTAGAGSCFLQFGGDFGPPPCVDSGDFRMLEAVWRDNSLWSGASAACVPPGDAFVRSCAHLIEVETVGTPSVEQDIMFGAPGQFFSWPAIRTDAADNLYVSLTHTNTSIFAEARIAGRRATDPPGTMSGSNLLKAGEIVHDSGRWGDYLGAALDPDDPACVWVVGEYAKSTSGTRWGTYIGATSYGTGCGPKTVGDVDCDGSITSVDAALILQFIAGLIPALPCPSGADVNLDGNINAIDAALILQFVAGLIPSLPP